MGIMVNFTVPLHRKVPLLPSHRTRAALVARSKIDRQNISRIASCIFITRPAESDTGVRYFRAIDSSGKKAHTAHTFR